jgi:hypothetical protein
MIPDLFFRMASPPWTSRSASLSSGLVRWAYRNCFGGWKLHLELLCETTPAVAIALVGYYFGIVIALAGVLDKTGEDWQERSLNLASYGAGVIGLMLAGAWVGDVLIMRRCDGHGRLWRTERRVAGAVEAGLHIANGLILSTALGGEGGTYFVGLVCWAVDWRCWCW